jgi:hypothetical protein
LIFLAYSCKYFGRKYYSGRNFLPVAKEVVKEILLDEKKDKEKEGKENKPLEVATKNIPAAKEILLDEKKERQKLLWRKLLYQSPKKFY